MAILARGRCGLSRCITWYLMSMAMADILVLVTAVILNRISIIYFPVFVLYTTPSCSFRIALIFAVRDSSVWLTVAFTFNRFVAICCQRLKTSYCTEKMGAIVIFTICIVSSVRNIPWYFVHEPLYIVNDIQWFCNIKLSFYSNSSWAAFALIGRMLNPCVPFLLMLLLNVLTVRHILASNRVREKLQVRGKGENRKDDEMESRKMSIILLFAISGSSILLWATYVVNIFYVQFTNGKFVSGAVLQESANMLLLLSCCINTCIYGVTQRRFRQEFKSGLQYPLNMIIKTVKS